METEIEDLKALVLNKVRDGENLLQQVQCHFTAVEGSKKLERRIRSEMKFLQKVKYYARACQRIYSFDYLNCSLLCSCWKRK